MRSYRWTRSGFVAVAVLALLGTFTSIQAEEADKPQAEGDAKPARAAIGEQAPDFELTDVKGKTHKLSDLKGQIVVLHFQSINCPWDKAYQSYLSETAKQYAKTTQGDEEIKVQFLGINANHNEEAESIAAYAKEREIPYPILKDEGNKVADAYKAKTTPHMYVIDREGVLRYMGGVEKVPTAVNRVTKMDEQYLEPVLEAVINGSEPPATETTSKGCGIVRVRK